MELRNIDDLGLFTALIVGEAGAENIIDKLAVACVVRNRKRDSRWPNSYRDVMLQEAQFSCFNGVEREGEIDAYLARRMFRVRWSEMWWRECRSSAFLVYFDWCGDITGGANHYYAPKLIDTPFWAEGRDPIRVGDAHLFYVL